jgi:signal transduction histidine kinase/DNA-binding response OmpR family regulator/CHASE3 domain sensor protein
MSRSERSESAELSRRLTVALVTPILSLVTMGSILGFQVFRMTEDARWVDHTDEVIATVTEVQKQIIDQETGLRGFLITESRIFLEPFEKADPLQGLARLRTLVSDNPVEVARVDEVRHRYEFWLGQTAVAKGDAPLPASRALAAMREGKREMDDTRTEIAAILDSENTLRHARVEAAMASSASAKTAFFLLFGLSAIVLAFSSRRQLSAIATTFREALGAEEAARAVLEEQEWIRAGQMKVSEALLGDLSLEQLGDGALRTLATYVGADVGALFTGEASGRGWKRRAAYALDPRADGGDAFGPGEGLVGAAALRTEVTHVRDVPADFLKVRSGTGERVPAEVVLVPSRVERRVQAIVELGFLKPVPARALDLLGRIGESVAIAVRSTEYKERLRDLLEESQRLTEELQAQQEELRVSNEELEEQTNAVRAAQAETEARQRELEETNARLEEQTNALQRTQRDVSEKAAEVERASRYKSEFLANMSHELRTPLNSSLILAKLLADNKEGNLTAEQVRFAETISLAGNDLLVLINDILDLSKIEAGKIDINVTETSLRRMADGLTRTFEPIAREKGLTLSVTLDEDAPRVIASDAQRVEQILKNLLSNALKFTEKGEVSLRISTAGARIRFSVRDTGIGIARDQQGLIFDAFRQADGASNRKYGGTGLGLSISRDLAKLLGGSIEVESEPGRGSVFTLTLPRALGAHASLPPGAAAGDRGERSESDRARTPALIAPALFPSSQPPAGGSASSGGVSKPAFEDDRAALDQSRRLVLVVEDDVAFAKILFDLAHELEFQCVVAHDAEGGLALARRHVPSAIVLDVNLPDHSGLSVLDRLKHDATTRHIPVHVVSSGDYAKTVLAMGAVGYMLKPVKREELVAAFRQIEHRLARRVRHLLIVEDDAVQRDSLTHLLEGPGIEVTAVGTVSDALAQLRARTIDCVVTDLTLPDTSGFDLLDQMGADDAYSFPPVIVYTGRSLSGAEEQRLRRYSSSIIVKGARSPERLVDEVTLFLHQVESELPPERQRMLRKARDREAVFDGRRILIVEDDVRNVFALSSVLEPKGFRVTIARNGREALSALEAARDIDIVLMDIMMPEMDGIEAMQHIRRRPEWAKLPIIALTAKAMKDDQERCLQAGANDYIPKPLDVDMLLSLLRVWMPK